ncbi:hypothetical protein UPYG_G00268070 [Umbra pygmaea]|uniref:Uncharacterized protein n=1 Tax=Umbra pygmaea TaxID=75934 RepID=A0ABD0WB68_UMBPY
MNLSTSQQSTSWETTEHHKVDKLIKTNVNKIQNAETRMDHPGHLRRRAPCSPATAAPSSQSLVPQGAICLSHPQQRLPVSA